MEGKGDQVLTHIQALGILKTPMVSFSNKYSFKHSVFYLRVYDF